jgi:cytochrome c553
MRHAYLATAAIAALAIAACADVSRSRDISNPNVPAVTLAQQVCSNCHGVTGVSISPIFPNLAAQRPAYIMDQLREFKSHDRSDPAGFEYMWGLSRGLTDAQIEGLAEYYAHQPPARGDRRAAADWIAAGDRIFHQGVAGKNVPPCMACHGTEGQGNEGFPRLAGQHMDYVMKQLVVFQRSDERPKGAVMKTVAHELTASDIRNVAAYVQSLTGPDAR